MAMVLTRKQTVKDLRDPDAANPLGEINSLGYEVVGAMTFQLGDLEDIRDANSKEDAARAELGAILRLQERVLRAMGRTAIDALELNHRAQRKLALIDTLDAEQGLDTDEPLKRARVRNREAHRAGRRTIQLSEPRGTSTELRIVERQPIVA